MPDTSQATAPLMKVAEARMAVQYLERAENWAAEVDEDIAAALVLIHRRLLDKILTMADGRMSNASG
jgi:hypothetical protein